jgi:2-oxoglutarate ferredoxin oxidoreductase subunit gamma
LKKTEIRICGLGGQGVVLAGQILGKAAVYDGKNVVQTQSYGAEARGTTAKSEVIISEDKIGFPMVRKCDILIALSQEALEKNIKDLKKEGILIIDNSIIQNIPENEAKIYTVPATELAEKTFGQRIFANMIMLGFLQAATNIVTEKSLEKAIKDTLPAKSAAINVQALKKGRELQHQ